MLKKLFLILCSAGLLGIAVASAQQPVAPAATPIPAGSPAQDLNSAPPAAPSPANEVPAPIEPPPPTGPNIPGVAPTPAEGGDQSMQTGTDTAAAPVSGSTQQIGTQDLGSGAEAGHALNEFQGDDVAQVLRLLARQAHISLVVSDKIADAQPPMKVTMRLEDKTPMQAINIIVYDKGLILIQKDGVYYVKTQEEKEAEPTESAYYTFSYANAQVVAPLLAQQLESKGTPQFDPRTNTIFYHEVGSNMDSIKRFLEKIDEPTKQVMIEARLIEVTANPSQSYGFNWAGVVGGASLPQSFTYGGASPGSSTYNLQTNPTTGQVNPVLVPSNPAQATVSNGAFQANNFLLNAQTGIGGLLRAYGGQFAILSVPQMTLTMRFLNEDADSELLANPRVVTANNQEATIKIVRNQPVPQLNFNSQTAQAVFGGFSNYTFGNTLVVTPCINKDNFVTLNVKPEISDMVADSVFTFEGATVSAPIIDTRDIESTVVIKSGDTLAIGGLLQDQISKTHNKVPVLGDIPGIGQAFQEHLNVRTKRNLLIFVTPTIIQQGYGTGLEDQISGLHHSGEEYADPNGWRNNANGAWRLIPTSHRDLAADYPKPGVPREPEVDFHDSASGGNDQDQTMPGGGIFGAPDDAGGAGGAASGTGGAGN
jgi:type IV pilus secretin PilQ/predicted competence protein